MYILVSWPEKSWTGHLPQLFELPVTTLVPFDPRNRFHTQRTTPTGMMTVGVIVRQKKYCTYMEGETETAHADP
jgi:hypothetical protein